MKALTLTEPWASAVAAGFKRIETRSWRAPHFVVGQRIAIHAAKRMTDDDLAFAGSLLSVSAFWAAGAVASPLVDHGGGIVALGERFAATRGCVIATATLVECVRFGAVREHEATATTMRLHIDVGRARPLVIDDIEYGFGDFTPGRFGFILADIARCPEPVPARGALGFWDFDPPAEWKGRAA
jgi:hypothetical protein